MLPWSRQQPTTSAVGAGPATTPAAGRDTAAASHLRLPVARTLRHLAAERDDGTHGDLCSCFMLLNSNMNIVDCTMYVIHSTINYINII